MDTNHDRYLSKFAPAAQAHMIDEIEAVKLLLEELISKHQAIEVTHIHWFMNPDARSKDVQPQIRVWCGGQITVSAKARIDRIFTTNPLDAQAMIN